MGDLRLGAGAISAEPVLLGASGLGVPWPDAGPPVRAAVAVPFPAAPPASRTRGRLAEVAVLAAQTASPQALDAPSHFGQPDRAPAGAVVWRGGRPRRHLPTRRDSPA